MSKKTVGECAKLIRGVSYKKQDAIQTPKEGYIPVLRANNIVNNQLVWTELIYVPCEYVNDSQYVRAGDVMITMSSGSKAHVGKVALANKDFFATFGAFCGKLVCEEIDPKYLAFVLQSRTFRQYIESASKGTNINNIKQSHILNYEIEVPQDCEQKRIVSKIEELFSKLDASVAELQTAKEKLKVYRQAVLKEAFTPGKDWKKLKALDVGEVKLGRQRSPQNVSNLYPTKYIRAANITEQGLDLSDVLEMEFTPTEQSKYTLQENDIVISEASGSPTQVGKPALWKCELQTCCFQNTVIRHRVKEANPEYVFWYYKYLYISGYFSRIVGGVGINHLGAKNFSNIEIPIPSVLDQTKIVQRIERVLSVYGNIEQTIDTSLQQAEALRQSILKQAFEGRL